MERITIWNLLLSLLMGILGHINCKTKEDDDANGKKLKVPRWIISSVVFLRQIHISTDRLSSQREKHFVQNRSDSNDSQIHEHANPHEKICFLCFPFGKLLYNFLLTVVSLPTGRERAREWNRFFSMKIKCRNANEIRRRRKNKRFSRENLRQRRKLTPTGA